MARIAICQTLELLWPKERCTQHLWIHTLNFSARREWKQTWHSRIILYASNTGSRGDNITNGYHQGHENTPLGLKETALAERKFLWLKNGVSSAFSKSSALFSETCHGQRDSTELRLETKRSVEPLPPSIIFHVNNVHRDVFISFKFVVNHNVVINHQTWCLIFYRTVSICCFLRNKVH